MWWVISRLRPRFSEGDVTRDEKQTHFRGKNLLVWRKQKDSSWKIFVALHVRRDPSEEITYDSRQSLTMSVGPNRPVFYNRSNQALERAATRRDKKVEG